MWKITSQKAPNTDTFYVRYINTCITDNMEKKPFEENRKLDEFEGAPKT